MKTIGHPEPYDRVLQVYEIEIIESQERWDKECTLAEDIVWFDKYNRTMRENVDKQL
jgi:hypothetical protein